MKKKFKIIMFIISFFLIITTTTIAFIYYKNNDKVAILGYHSILPKELNNNTLMTVNLDKFEKQLKTLKKLGYKTMTLEEFDCWKNNKCKKPHKSVLITFDDGYKDNYEYAFKILKKYNMNAVVFVVGKYADGENYMDLDTIKKSKQLYPNIEFASHSFDLHYHSDKTYEIVDEDIKEMHKMLESKYYAYPFGDYTEQYIDALKDNGYTLAFTFGPGKEHRKADINDDNYKIPRLNISNDMSILKFILRVVLPI